MVMSSEPRLLCRQQGALALAVTLPACPREAATGRVGTLNGRRGPAPAVAEQLRYAYVSIARWDGLSTVLRAQCTLN